MDKALTKQLVKEWMQLDGEIAALKRQARGLEDKKRELTKQIVGVMKENQIDAFDLTEGKLIRQNKKTKSGLTKAYLADCFSKYFKGESEAVKDLSNLIFSSRQEKSTDIIMCKKR
jgi:hypothetical protein